MTSTPRRQISLTMPRHELRRLQLALDLTHAERSKTQPGLTRLSSSDFAARCFLRARATPHLWIFGSAFRPRPSTGPVGTLPANWPLALHSVVDEDIAQVNAVADVLLDGARTRRSTYLRAAIGWSAKQVCDGTIENWIFDSTPTEDVASHTTRLDLYLAQLAAS